MILRCDCVHSEEVRYLRINQLSEQFVNASVQCVVERAILFLLDVILGIFHHSGRFGVILQLGLGMATPIAILVITARSNRSDCVFDPAFVPFSFTIFELGVLFDLLLFSQLKLLVSPAFLQFLLQYKLFTL